VSDVRHEVAPPPGTIVTAVDDEAPAPGPAHLRFDSVVGALIVAIEYAIIASLLLVAAIVLVRTVVTFFHQWSDFPDSVVDAIDGILVVIILLDLVHTVFRRLRALTFPIRPFLFIGILAGIREILSSSARLTLSSHLTSSNFHDTIISLGVGVGVVIFLLLGLFLLDLTKSADEEY
jgi:uncharacterized membrane protein (DUF373 family)